MESRRMTTRSSRRASTLPVSPVKEAVVATVTQGTGKATTKRGGRKALTDKTNATPEAGVVPAKSAKKTPVVAAVAIVKAEEEVMSPCRKLQSFEQQPATPVVERGEDLLRSLVHSNLAIIQTPEGLSRESPEAETPQFGVPAARSPPLDTKNYAQEAPAEVDPETPQFGVPAARSPPQDSKNYAQEAAAEVDVSPPLQMGEVVDARPPMEASIEILVATASRRQSLAWVGRDVDEVTEVGEDDDSDCSVLVNVSSSPGMHLIVSPAPATTVHTTTPETGDFKWQRRDQSSLKVKEQQEPNSFSYYGGDDEYEGCDEYDAAEDYNGEVIDCDEICQAISRMGVAEVTAAGLPEHKGRHIRFNYNSDDEVDVEEVDVMRLRGLPTPTGKHLRFPEDQDMSTL